MRRTSSFKKFRANNENFGFLWENGIGCPIGTVPIKIVTKEELLGLSSFSENYKPQGSWKSTYNQVNGDNDQHHVSSIFVIFFKLRSSYIL